MLLVGACLPCGLVGENFGLLGVVRLDRRVSMYDARDEGQIVLVHETRNFCQNFILADVLVSIAGLVALDDLDLLTDFRKPLVDVHVLLCHLDLLVFQEICCLHVG